MSNRLRVLGRTIRRLKKRFGVECTVIFTKSSTPNLASGVTSSETEEVSIKALALPTIDRERKPKQRNSKVEFGGWLENSELMLIVDGADLDERVVTSGTKVAVDFQNTVAPREYLVFKFQEAPELQSYVLTLQIIKKDFSNAR